MSSVNINEALKNLPQNTGGTKWITPEQAAAKKNKVSASNSATPAPAAPATPTPKPAPATPVTKPAPTTPVTKPAPTTPTAKPAPATPVTKPAPTTPTAKPAPATPTAKPAPATKVSSCGQQQTTRKAHEPEPDFKAKLEQLHMTPNRPGVIAQHEYVGRQPVEMHASYTKCKSHTTWTKGTPETFDDRVDWLEQTDKIHTYEYQTQKTVYTTPPPSKGYSNSYINHESSGNMSSLIARYNNRTDDSAPAPREAPAFKPKEVKEQQQEEVEEQQQDEVIAESEDKDI